MEGQQIALPRHNKGSLWTCPSGWMSLGAALDHRVQTGFGEQVSVAVDLSRVVGKGFLVVVNRLALSPC